MLIKSALITQASGSVGGFTAARNRAGMYIRARAKPVDPSSTLQQTMRSIMQAASIAWHQTLTETQRTGWETYASNVPIIGRLGDPIYLTGMAHYIRSRAAAAYYSLTPVADAPTVFNLATFTPVTVSISEATQQLSVVLDNTDAWANEDDAALLVSQSKPVNPTVNYFRGPFVRRGKVDGDSVTPPTSPAAFTSAYPVVEDQRFFAFVRAIRADGRLSTPQYATGTVLA